MLKGRLLAHVVLHMSVRSRCIVLAATASKSLVRGQPSMLVGILLVAAPSRVMGEKFMSS